MGKNEVSDNEAASEQDHADPQMSRVCIGILNLIREQGPQTFDQIVRKLSSFYKKGDLTNMIQDLVNRGKIDKKPANTAVFCIPCIPQDDSEENHQARDRESYRRDSPTKPPLNSLLMSRHKLKRKKL